MVQVNRSEGMVGNTAIKAPCRLASTANVATLNGLLTIDGSVTVAGDRVLLTAQTSSIDNGIWVADTGDWERSDDCDGVLDVVFGSLVKVNSGSANSGFWYCSTTTDPIIMGTTAVNFGMASTVLAVISAFMQTLLDDADAAAAAVTLGVIPNAIVDAVGDLIIATAADTVARSGMPYGFSNGSLTLSVAANALTIARKGTNGADPSATNPVYDSFRSATASTGTPSVVADTAAASLVVSSGSTLGARSAVPFRLWIVEFNDGGTKRLGVINCVTTVAGAGSGSDVTVVYPLAGWGIASSTAEGGAGAADSAQTIYTGTAVTSKSYTVLGYATWETGLTTAGTWDAGPTRVQLFGPGVALPGQQLQVARTDTGAMATGTTTVPLDDTIPQNTEGDQYMSLAITPASAANILEPHAHGFFANSAGSNIFAISLYQDSVANALKTAPVFDVAAAGEYLGDVAQLMLAATTAATTFKCRAGLGTAGTTTFNGRAGARDYGGVVNSFMEIREIQG